VSSDHKVRTMSKYPRDEFDTDPSINTLCPHSRSFNRHIKKLNVFMNMCREISTLSHDPKYKVAALVITPDYREVCAIGYNGDYAGGPNERESLEHGKSNFIHAEENVLVHLCKPFELRHNLILFCTHKPCTMCAKKLVNAGLKTVLYDQDYIDAIGQTNDIFRRAGVFSMKLEDLLSSRVFLSNYIDSHHM